ncbi:MAG: hypothetical protein V1493_00130 [Candidatus Diapherotrites archaeon]
MKKQFIAEIKEPLEGLLVLPLPRKIMEELRLKPFMAADWQIQTGRAKLAFSKTTKIKLDIDKKTIRSIKQMMAKEGFGSMDEAVSNIVLEYLEKLGFKTKTDAITFIYPIDYFRKKHWLIEKYEKGRVKST